MQPSFIVLVLRISIVLLLFVFLGIVLRTLRSDLDGEKGSVVVPPANLFTAEGPGVGTVYPLEESNLIGRSPSCTIEISEPTVSSTHARLTYTNRKWLLEDLGSRNGTRVNDLPVDEPMPVVYGDRIHIGSVMLILTSRLDPPTQPELRDFPSA